MRKQMAFGFMTGLICTFCILGTTKFVEAATKMAQTVNYPIYIDNVAWAPSTPALNVEGSTYLPLRAMSEALGVQIDWSKEYRRVDVYKNKKPGDFPIGDGSVPTTTTPSTSQATITSSTTLYNYIINNAKNNMNLLGANEVFCTNNDGGIEVAYMKNYNSSDKSFTGQIRFDLTNLIYKSIDANKVATWVNFDKAGNATSVSIAAKPIIDTTDAKYASAVNDFKKNYAIFQNDILKNTKNVNLLGLTIEELKAKNY